MAAPDIIKQLVKRFEEQSDSYRTGRYNETQLRREFLDPFIKALGWDIDNEQGYAETYKDVIHEDSLEVEGATKAPDYAFRIGGTRKFFVEAKKPAVNIQYDIFPAFQLRRYAWSAKLPLSILTDFEEFAVYESRSKPDKSDSAATGRVMLLNYRDYLVRWDELAAIFSREAVLKGSFDHYAEGLKGKKGTTEVDDAFLQDIETWRDLLARIIALRNPDLQVRELNYAIQMTIDRIVFLRICEDRGIERENQLQELLVGEQVYERLCQVFRQADNRYNSGLFHFSEEKGQSSTPDDLTLRITIDDKVLREIISGLYYPAPYVFREIPADILGQVYERFLGKVIRLTAGHQAKVEEKPEVRKAGGVFYTPTYIVDYIVKNTVGKLLEGKTPKEANRLKILDPACGSGSFLLGAFQYLLDWHTEWYSKHEPETWTKGKAPVIYQAQGGDYRLTTAEKKRILVDSIHGVDIDPQAVEVTKLSLSLKVLEGESQESIGAQLGLFKERALPDLGKNIQCGNSLIGPDYYEGQMFPDEEERYRVNAFNWQAAFPQVFIAGGFDVVIGNPPYIRAENMPRHERDYYMDNNRFSVAYGRFDIHILFLERAIKFLKDGGKLGYIIPYPALNQSYAKLMRRLILDTCAIETIVDLSKYKVFKAAEVSTCIVILRKERREKRRDNIIFVIQQSNYSTGIHDNEFAEIPQLSFDTTVENMFRLELTSGTNNISTKLDASSLPLGKICYAITGVVAHDSKTGASKDRLIHPIAMGQNPKPYIEAKEISGRYSPLLPIRFIEYVSKEMHRPKFPELFEKPKILIPDIIGLGRLIATFDLNGIFTNHSFNCCVLKNDLIEVERNLGITAEDATLSSHYSLFYVLGLVNSKLITYYFKANLGGGLHASPANIRRLPIRIINFSVPVEKAAHDKMISLVERMLALHQEAQSARAPQEKEMIQREIESTDEEIDYQVYKLYGLTKEEIKIVERM